MEVRERERERESERLRNQERLAKLFISSTNRFLPVDLGSREKNLNLDDFHQRNYFWEG